MDKLYTVAQFYKDHLLNRKFHLKAGKNKREIEFDIVFAASNFKHLLGLNKLSDLAIISGNGSAVNYRQILNKELTYDYISQSKYFSDVEQRIEHFEDLYKALNGKDLMLKSQFGKFNTIVADFMLTNKNENYGYAHLFLLNDDKKGFTVPVTYIINPDNAYLQNNAERWTVLSVEEVKKAKDNTKNDLTEQDEEVIKRIRSSKLGSDFDKLYKGEDKSANADNKLAQIITFFAGNNTEQAKRIFKSSALGNKSEDDLNALFLGINLSNRPQTKQKQNIRNTDNSRSK